MGGPRVKSSEPEAPGIRHDGAGCPGTYPLRNARLHREKPRTGGTLPNEALPEAFLTPNP